MNFRLALARKDEWGVTMIEVMVSALLILLALGSIFTMNARSLSILRATRQVAASSQVLQQRIESIREHVWPEISSAVALAALMQTATQSEKEFSDADLVETAEISVPVKPGDTAPENTQVFTVQRRNGKATVLETGDLGAQPMLLVKVTLTWRAQHGPAQRDLQTVICRTGLTRSGIFGSTLGQPAPPAAKVTSDLSLK